MKEETQQKLISDFINALKSAFCESDEIIDEIHAAMFYAAGKMKGFKVFMNMKETGLTLDVDFINTPEEIQEFVQSMVDERTTEPVGDTRSQASIKKYQAANGALH